jgi:hypothetical protein
MRDLIEKARTLIPVDGLRRLGVNSGMRCPMQTEKTVAVDGKESESNRGQPVAWWEHKVTTQSVLS